MVAIETEVADPAAPNCVFDRPKMMYNGTRIARGDTIFTFASENEGGPGDRRMPSKAVVAAYYT